MAVSRSIPHIPREGEPGAGNYLSRHVMEGDDLHDLIDTHKIDSEPVVWDVGVPMLDDRPVVDDRLIHDGLTHNQRANLSIGFDEENGLIVALTTMHASMSDLSPLDFKPPVIQDAESGVFSPTTQHDSYTSIWINLSRNGSIGFYAAKKDTGPITLFQAESPASQEYERCITFIERMLHIPRDGRKPLNTTDSPLSV